MKLTAKLAAAVEEVNLENVRELLNQDDIDAKHHIIWQYGLTVQQKHVEILKLLVEHGAIVDVALLQHIFELKNSRLVEELLDHIIKYNNKIEDLQIIFYQLATSKFQEPGALEIFKILLDRGLPVNNFEDGYKLPFFVSIVSDRIEFVSIRYCIHFK